MDDLKDHQIAEVVNTLRDIAVEFHSAQQLRERIAHVIVPLLSHRAVPQANAEQDAERINYLEAWNTKNKGKGFFWNTFSFSVSKTVREQLDESIRSASKTTPSSGEGGDA